MQTGHVDIPLSRPFSLDGVEVSTLRMREPTVADLRAASRSSAEPADQELTLFANLLGIPPQSLNALPLRDYTRVQRAYEGFTN